MKISLNWLKEWMDLSDFSSEDLAHLLTHLGLEVEEVVDQSKGFEKVVTAKILKKKKHPNADKLSVCEVIVKEGTAPLQIVCGAKNMDDGDMVALAQVGAHLPNGVQIKKSKIRNIESEGMLCAENELHLAESSEGILILPPNTPLGKPLAEYLGRDDVIFDLSVTPNRGDCLSHLGIAREISAKTGKKINLPKIKLTPMKGAPIRTALKAGEDAKSFWGALIEGVQIQPSPNWLKNRLEVLGLKSINNIVDISNYVLMERGHPNHAYDADRIEGEVLSVRLAKPKEKLPLLDDTSIQCEGTELVIADQKKAVALAGVMGGGNSEVSASTTRIYLEVAEFSPVLVRRAAKKHGKQTEAAHRFERGIDPGDAHTVLSRLVSLITEIAGGKLIGATSAIVPSHKKIRPPKIEVSPDYFNAFLGTTLKTKDIEKILNRNQCSIQKKSKSWCITPPSHRLDLTIKEDLAEEVARFVGYDEIPSTIPPLTGMPHFGKQFPEGFRHQAMEKTKDALTKAGFLETIHYSFESREWISKFQFDTQIKIQNPMSEEQECLVPSLIPGLVRTAIENFNRHFGADAPSLRLFELRPTFHLGAEKVFAEGETQTGVREDWKLSLLLCGARLRQSLKPEQNEVDFYDLKGTLENLFESLGLKGVRFHALGGSRLFHPGKSAELRVGKKILGSIGQLHPALSHSLKLKTPLYLAELDWTNLESLAQSIRRESRFQPWSEFPSIERDFAILIRSDAPIQKLIDTALSAARPIGKDVRVFDIYRGSQVPEGMTSVAVRVIFLDEARSLEEADADQASRKILDRWQTECGAVLRS